MFISAKQMEHLRRGEVGNYISLQHTHREGLNTKKVEGSSAIKSQL